MPRGERDLARGDLAGPMVATVRKMHLFLVSDQKQWMYQASREKVEKDGKNMRKENKLTKSTCPLSKNDQSTIIRVFQ